MPLQPSASPPLRITPRCGSRVSHVLRTTFPPMQIILMIKRSFIYEFSLVFSRCPQETFFVDDGIKREGFAGLQSRHAAAGSPHIEAGKRRTLGLGKEGFWTTRDIRRRRSKRDWTSSNFWRVIRRACRWLTWERRSGARQRRFFAWSLRWRRVDISWRWASDE